MKGRDREKERNTQREGEAVRRMLTCAVSGTGCPTAASIAILDLAAGVYSSISVALSYCTDIDCYSASSLEMKVGLNTIGVTKITQKFTGFFRYRPRAF